MSSILANTRLAVYRGVTQNALGDEVDDNTTVLRDYTSWVEQRRNLSPNPGFEVDAGNYSQVNNAALVRITNLTAPPIVGAASGRVSIAAANGTADSGIGLASFQIEQGESYIIAFTLRAVQDGRWNGYLGGVWSDSSLRYDTGAMLAGETRRIEIVRTALMTGSSSPMYLLRHTSTIGKLTEVDIDAVVYEKGATLGLPPFDGDTFPNGELVRTRWLGTAGKSASVLETRTVVRDYGRLPASVIERTKRVQDPETGTWRSVPYLKARMVNPSLDIRQGDRVRDLRTGDLMTVDSITRTPRSLAGSASLTLDLTDRA